MESDKEIPLIYERTKGLRSPEIKKEFVSFLNKFREDVNDYGGKIVKIVKLLQKDFKSLSLLMKYFNSQNNRKILQKVSSCWVVENMISNTVAVLMRKKKVKNVSKFFKFLAIFNLTKIRNFNVLKDLAKLCSKMCGRYIIEDKYILQIVQKIIEKIEKNFRDDKEAKLLKEKVFNKIFGLSYTYFGILGHKEKSKNIDFLRNYYSTMNIIMTLDEELSSIKTVKRKIKQYIVVEQKNDLFENWLKILVMNLNLFESKSSGLVNPKNKIYKKIISGNSYQLRALKIYKEGDLNPFSDKRHFKAFNSNSSSTFSTSDSNSILKRDTHSHEILKRIKIISCKLIEFLIKNKKKIFLQKTNWRMIIPPTSFTKLHKNLLQEKILFPSNFYKNDYLKKLEEEKSEFLLTKNLKKFLLDWKEKNTQEKFNKDTANFQMVNLKSKILMSLRSKNSSDTTLLGSFMLETDREIKEILMLTLAMYIKAQPVDIWLTGRNLVNRKTVNSFKDEVANSMKVSIVVVLLELCINQTGAEKKEITEGKKMFHKNEKIGKVWEKIGDEENFILKNLLEFFEFDYLVKYMNEIVEFVLEMVILPNLDLRILKNGGIKIEFRDLLCKILRRLVINKEVFDKEFLEEFIDEILVDDQIWSDELLNVLIDILKTNMVELSREKVEKIFEFFLNFEEIEIFKKAKFKLLATLLEEYQEFLDPKNLKNERVSQKRVMTDELIEKTKIKKYFKIKENKLLFESWVKKIFRSCFEGDIQQNTLLMEIFEILEERNLNNFLESFGEEKDEITRHLITSLVPKDQITLLGKFLKSKNLNLSPETIDLFWEQLLTLSHVKKNLFNCLFAISSIFTSHQTEIENQLSKAQIKDIFLTAFDLIKKRSRRYVVNSLKIINLILVNLSDEFLQELLRETEEVNKDILIDIFDQYLHHKFPKYSWNTAYLLHDILIQENKGKFIKEFKMQIIDYFKEKIVVLFLETPNVKLKFQLGCVILLEDFRKKLRKIDFEEILFFCDSLVKREWEEENLPKYKVIGTLNELKSQSVELVKISCLKIFENILMEENEELGDELRCKKICVGFVQKIMEEINNVLKEKKVIFGYEDEELGKFKPRQVLKFEVDPEADKGFLELFDFLKIMRNIIEQTDEIEYSLLELDKLVALEKKKIVGEIGGSLLYSVRNVYAVEAMKIELDEE